MEIKMEFYGTKMEMDFFDGSGNGNRTAFSGGTNNFRFRLI
jgi:hypothetical protein